MSIKMKNIQLHPTVAQECRRLFVDVAYLSPLVSRVATQSLIKTFVVDYEHETTVKALEETPNCLDRFRTFFVVDKHSIPWFHINLDWWDTASYENKLFRFQTDITKFLNEHFNRNPTKINKTLVPRAFVDDGSEFTVIENLFTYSGYERSAIQHFHPRDEYPTYLNEKAPNGSRYVGRSVLEPVSIYLDSLIDPGDSEKNSGNTPAESLAEAAQGAQGDGDGDSEGESESDSAQSGEPDGKGSKKFLKEILEDASDEEIKNHMDQNPDQKYKWDNEPSSLMKRYQYLKPVPKMRWENIIQILTARSPEYTQSGTWNRQNVALAGFLNPYNGRLPANQMIEKPVINKAHIALFADTSGSCVSYWDRFAKAAISLPDEKFEAELFAFDTKVYSIDKNNLTMKGGGGTRFDIIVNSVNDYEKRNGVYPHVAVITDGVANVPNIAFDKQHKWVWLLTEGGSTQAIPKGCKIVNLADYE